MGRMRQKRFVLWLLVLMMAMAWSGHACGQNVQEDVPEFLSGDFWYTLDAAGNACLTGYIGYDLDLVIPDRLDGHVVTAIGARAFENWYSLSSITLPDSVVAIEGNPFTDCPNAALIISPNHPTLDVMDGVLYEKTSRTLIAYPAMRKAAVFVVPEGIAAIGADAFAGCGGLESIVLPESLTTIVGNPFQYCYASIVVPPEHPVFESIDGVLYDKNSQTLIAYPANRMDSTFSVPNGVTAIGSEAFADAAYLISIALPDSVTLMQGNPFVDCYALLQIYVSPEHPTHAVIDGVLYEKANRSLVSYPNQKPDTFFAVPEGIAAIGAEAFANNAFLNRVVLPQGVRSIGNGAFAGVLSLTDIALPESLVSIGDRAFYGCALTGIAMPERLVSIGKEAFMYCTALTSVTLPQGVTSVADGTFSGCASLTDVQLPENVVTIGDWAFSYCGELARILWPQSLVSIGEDAFAYCGALTDVVLPEGLARVGKDAFAACDALTGVNLPASLTEIGEGAFSYGNPDLVLTVPRDSYARQYAINNGITYTYLDANDWLLGN